jgi:uncharacterized protein YbaA (DUF1428 family)
VIPVPTLTQLAEYSGRPEVSYTSYAASALIQAVIIFTAATEINYGNTSDFAALNSDDQQLAIYAILAYADWTYLKQPYQQMIANPAMSEVIGDYSFSKPPPVQVRNVQAQELGIGSTGIELWDTAVQMLSKRTRAGGVFFGQLRCFDRTDNSADREMGIVLREDRRTGELVLLGPADFDQVDIPGFSINGEAFPHDPGI